MHVNSRSEQLTQRLRQFHSHRILEDIGSRTNLRKGCECRNTGMELSSHDLAEAKRGDSANFARIFRAEHGFLAIVTQGSEHVCLFILVNVGYQARWRQTYFGKPIL